jgi:hypothetical protein
MWPSNVWRAIVGIAATIVMAGCDGPSPPDAAPPDAGSDAGRAEPIAPAMPTWGACPAGWSAESIDVTQDAVASGCAPPARVVCAGATIQPVGSAACEPIDPCEGRFADDLPADRPHRFVDAAAEPGGDGSEAMPFASLDAALAGADGAALALAAGEYTAGALPDDVVIMGSCAAEVRIVSSGGAPALGVQRTQRLELSGVTLTGDGAGLMAHGEVALRNVLVDRAIGVGIGGVGATIDAERVVVRDTRSLASGAFGRGISVESGAVLTLRDVVIERSHEAGLAAGAATIDAERIAVIDSAPRPEGRYGAGVAGFGAASITLREAWIDGASEAGVTVEADTTLALDRVLIEDVVAEAGRTSGQGVLIRNGPATLSRLTIRRAHGAGLVATGTAVVRASDLTVHEITPRAGFANAIAALAGAQLTLERAAALDCAWVAVVLDEGSLIASDLSVSRIAESLNLGMALIARGGGAAEVRRFRFTDLHTVGVMVSDVDSTAHFSEGLVRGVNETEEHRVGRGFEVDVGATLILEDVEVQGVVEAGVLAFGGGMAGTRASLHGVRVSGIAERACAATTCPTEGGGTGVAALFGAVIEAEELTVRGAPLCGVQVAEGASMDVSSGTLSGSAIGACVAVPDYDLTRVVDGVVFVDNERNVETASVYVPPRGPTF